MFASAPTILLCWCLAAFLSGSIPFGLLLVKLAGKGDVRTQGSGNIGATNVARTGGKGLGVLVLLLDVLKGYLPVFLALRWGHGPEMAALLALAAVAGHVFTPWLRFRGGKGVATALGTVLAAAPWMALLPLALFVAAMWLTRQVSLGSILACVAVPAELALVQWTATLWGPWGWTQTWTLVAWTLLALLVIWRHKDNIARLQAGTERRFGTPKEG